MKATIKYLIAMPGLSTKLMTELQLKQNAKRKLKLIMLVIGRLKHDENG
jgi:hypothetical protein